MNLKKLSQAKLMRLYVFMDDCPSRDVRNAVQGGIEEVLKNLPLEKAVFFWIDYFYTLNCSTVESVNKALKKVGWSVPKAKKEQLMQKAFGDPVSCKTGTRCNIEHLN